jgi:two-component system sensor histidine kinase HydH
VKQLLFGRYSWPLVAFGGLVAVACLASTWYINRLQTDLARAVRNDAAGMEAAVELQVQLRHLRVHTLVLLIDPSTLRREAVQADLSRVDNALAAIRQVITTSDDIRLAEMIERDYTHYRNHLGLDNLPPPTASRAELACWSDDHHMAELLVPCQELAGQQRDRMNAGLARAELQTAWAGRLLIGLGLAGVLAGLLSGYATARALTRRVAKLFVRVQAVQAHLNQDVGAMTVEAPQSIGDLDAQLEVVIGRVKEVCLRLQEQERALLRAEQLAAVGQLAAGVAHEVRNPLTGVKLLIQAAVRPVNPATLSLDRLNLLLQEIDRIERTVQGLVDSARTPPPDCHPQDFLELVTEASAIAQSRAETREVAIRVISSDNSHPVCVDRDQMLSLLTNLLFNAIDASPCDSDVEVRIANGSDGTLTVEVTDSGPGIDPALESRLFIPFATTKPKGTGLGLSIARRVALEHGGTLTARNRPGGGACFSLVLHSQETLNAQAPPR